MIDINNHESERLKFRNLVPEDTLKLFEIYSDGEAMKYRNSKPMKNMEDAKAFIQNQKLETDIKYVIRKGVELKEDKELIGSVMYKYIKNKETECIIGYSIGANYWGRGLGREIVKTLVESIEQQEKTRIIKAWTKPQNIASQKILEINNFHQIPQSEYPDSYLYIKQVRE